MPDDQKLRVAVVGTGKWWGYQHARLYHSRPDTELVAILGRTQAKADARAAELGVTGYDDVHRLLSLIPPEIPVEVTVLRGREKRNISIDWN